ncbi:MAG: urease accessory protein, partial [Actinomycetota bacterium]|nr:urease accessory protein [Actinomycetota bacterium]
LGRGLTRLGKRAWPHPGWAALTAAPHHPIAIGVAAAAAGVDPAGAAQVAAYLTISGPATAAQRLMSLDPLTVAAITAGLCARIDAIADLAARDPNGELSAVSDPWFDLLAETHASRKDRLFAS